MSSPKKQHYVSQFILRNFSIEEKDQLWIYDKWEEKEYRASIRDSACEKYFYEFSEDSEETNTELKLSRLESDCYSIFKKVIEEKSIKSITNVEHSMICLFSAVQLLRTNKSREQIEQTNQGLIDKVKEKGNIVEDFEKVMNLSKDEIKDISLVELNSSAGKLAPYFVEKEFALVESPEDEHFYISDNPITLYNHYPRPFRGNLGLKLKGIEIQFPISSNLCLVFMCPETINEVRMGIERVNFYKENGIDCPVDMTIAEEYLKSFDNCLCGKLTKENVEYHNSLQVIQSSRYIYSCTDNFNLVKKMIKSDPELKNPKRIDFL
jgi:hypothetical protein